MNRSLTQPTLSGSLHTSGALSECLWPPPASERPSSMPPANGCPGHPWHRGLCTGEHGLAREGAPGNEATQALGIGVYCLGRKSQYGLEGRRQVWVNENPRLLAFSSHEERHNQERAIAGQDLRATQSRNPSSRSKGSTVGIKLTLTFLAKSLRKAQAGRLTVKASCPGRNRMATAGSCLQEEKGKSKQIPQ